MLIALRNKRSKDRSRREDNRKLLFYVNEKLQEDREIVLAAVTGIGQALEYLPEGFESDKEVVLTAVQSDGKALKYASQELQEDREIVLAALKNS